MLNKFIKFFSYFTIIISIILIVFLISYKIYSVLPKDETKEDSTSPYIPIAKRESSIIVDVDDSLLSKYYTEDKILVIFWASWCSNCQSETDTITRFIQENNDATVIIVSHDNDKSDLEEYVNNNNLNWYIIYDRLRSIRNSIDPDSTFIPNTYVLDRTGAILNHHVGLLEYDDLVKLYNLENLDE